MTKGYIQNLRNYTLPIQQLGWIMPPLVTETIETIHGGYELFLAAQTELTEKITAGDIEIRGNDGNTMTSADLQVWLTTAWAEERSIPRLIQHRFDAELKGRVPPNGIVAFRNGDVLHTQAGFSISRLCRLRRMAVSVNAVEFITLSNELRICRQPTAPARDWVAGAILNMPGLITRFAEGFYNDRQILLVPGAYGLFLKRVNGPAERSNFNRGSAAIIVEEVDRGADISPWDSGWDELL